MNNFTFQMLPCSTNFKEPQEGVLFSAELLKLFPGITATISLGFKAWFPLSFVALVSDQVTHEPFRVLSAVVRGDCQQEWVVRVRSLVATPYLIGRGSPVASFVLVPRLLLTQQIVDDLPAPAGSGITLDPQE